MQLHSSYRSIWQLTYPIIIGSIALGITQLIDAVFLGRLGMEYLGAVNLSGMFFMFLIMIAMGFTRGGQIIFARRAGEKKEDKIGHSFDHMILLCIAICLLMVLLILFYNSYLSYTIIQSDSIRTLAIDYLAIRGWSLPFALLNVGMMAFFTGIGKTRIISYATVVLAIVNIVFDWLLIFGNGGFPAMEIKGAAWASNLAEVSSTLVYLGYAWKEKFIRDFKLFKFEKIEIREIQKIVYLSAPLVVQNIIGLGSWQVFFLMIEKMGEEELGISTIIKSLYMFIGIPIWSFATAANALVSNLLGQQKYDEVLVALKRVIIMSTSFAAITCLVVLIFPEQMLGIYTTEAHIIEKSLTSLYVILGALMLFSVGIPLFMGLIGSGDTMVALLIESIIVTLYLIWTYLMIVKYSASLPVAWTAELVYWSSIIIASLIYLKTERWKKIKV